MILPDYRISNNNNENSVVFSRIFFFNLSDMVRLMSVGKSASQTWRYTALSRIMLSSITNGNNISGSSIATTSAALYETGNFDTFSKKVFVLQKK